MIPDWLPGIHPLVVHFPIALFVVAVGFDCAAAIRKSENLASTATLLYLIAGVTAVAAFFSGRRLADRLLIPPAVLGDLNAHADWGLRAVWFIGVYGLVRLLGWQLRSRIPRSISLGLSALSLVGLFVLIETAEHGGQLVFKHGLGITPSEVAVQPLPQTEVGDIFTRYSDGAWGWQPQSELASIVDQMEWLPAGAPTPSISLVADSVRGAVLSLTTDQSVLVVFGDSVESFQFDAAMNLSRFVGSVSLVHNLVSEAEYHYLSVSTDGDVRQGSHRSGDDDEMDLARRAISGWIDAGVVGADTHYRGYVDRELTTHGHGEAASRGRVGFRLNGIGTVLIASFRVTPAQ